MKDFSKTPVGEIVALNYRTADVFKAHAIDFCCNGHRTLQEACTLGNLNMETVITELETALQEDTNRSDDYMTWPIDLLTDYIEKKHHRYVEERIPEIRAYLEKITQVHGAQHPELEAMSALFVKASGELVVHMKKEELMLFPFIRKMVNATRSQEKINSPQFGTVENPIEMMAHEHDMEGEYFRTMNKLSKGYTLPEDACSSYQVTFSMLQEFESDLHLHIHLENNILFPKVKALETELRENELLTA